MKRYKLLAAIVATMTLTTGCYDLDLYPEDSLSAGTFFKTKAHADQAMMGVYNQMQNNYVFGRQFGFDCLGNVGAGYDKASYQIIAQGNLTTTDIEVSEKFRNLYEGITRANKVLQNIDACAMTDVEKIQYKAEAKFMRALYYFTLTDYWGGVPVYDETTNVEENFLNMLKPKSSLEEVRTFIIKDLDDAITYLPIKWDNSNNGRATSGAALALKGKILLYAKKYDEAKACFEEVMGLTGTKYKGMYELYSEGDNPYRDLFTPIADASSEMIFAIQNLGGVGQDFGMPMCFYMGTRSSFGGCWNNVMAATDFVDSYEWKDGTEFDWETSHTIGSYTWNGYPNYNSDNKVKEKVFYSTLSSDATKIDTYTTEKDNLLAMYEQRDPRMATTIILPYTIYKGWYKNAPMDCEFAVGPEMGQYIEKNGFIRLNDARFKYPWRKFVPEYNMDGAINNRADTPINFPLIRLADVKLMYAECLLFCSTPDITGACAQISDVRKRAGMPAVTASSVDEAFKKLRHERRIELAAEGHSFSDMKRWGVLVDELNGKPVVGVTGKVEFTRVVTDREYLWPFPQTEIDMNPALKEGQNPGW